MTTDGRRLRSATCLGCGCGCDDIGVRVRDGRIVAAERACELGLAWFGDGRAPARVLVEGHESSLDAALDAAGAAVAGASRPLVYLAPDLSCEAQREGVALADLLRAVVDSVTSATVMRTILAAQERGRASATLGEIRNRADVLICWAVDPAVRYPRYWSRYAPEPRGTHVPEGRRSRTVVAVDVGDSRGPADADHRVAMAPAHEVAVLTALAAAADQDRDAFARDPDEPVASLVGAFVEPLREARYVALLADAEPDPGAARRDPCRADGLIALAQAWNGPTRCALSLLRGGGNRSGADAVLTWQTGYPAAVDFARGYPRYGPHDGTAGALLERGDIDLVLLLGAVAGVPPAVSARLSNVRTIVVGPCASAVPAAAVAIDTGTVGIHHGGTAVRLDDVPLPLEGWLSGPPATETIVRALTERIVTTQGFYP
jgi:formylmethanofuran dehydrogenase subunit B